MAEPAEWPGQFGFGQWIDADRPIAGALPGEGAAYHATLRIRHEAPAPAPDLASPDDILARSDDGLIFTPPGIGRYRCRADGVTVTPVTDVDPEALAALLIATALPACLWLQGAFVLHAAVLRLPGQHDGIAIAGPSGAGKSTIAAHLIAEGAALVADDSAALIPMTEFTIASGLPGGYFETIGTPDERRFVSLKENRVLERIRIGAVFVVSRGTDAESFTRLTPPAAATAFLANRHRPGIPAVLGRHAETLAMATLLAATIPVYAWQRQEGMDRVNAEARAMLQNAAR